MITILIKTFLRHSACDRLVRSIREFYPNIRILVAIDDDSGVEFEGAETIVMPYDCGLSYARNRLVEMTETPYVVILDDDCIFTENTNLDGVLKELQERDLDILQFTIKDTRGNSDIFRGLMKINGDTFEATWGDRDGLYDFVANVFIAKKDTLLKYKWHEELKLGEHEAYFRRHLGKMRIGHTKAGEIMHDHTEVPNYKQFRDRAFEYMRQSLEDDGIAFKTDLYGNILNI